MQEVGFRSLVWEGPLAEGRDTHSSVLAWRLPGTEEPGVSRSGTGPSDSAAAAGAFGTSSVLS